MSRKAKIGWSSRWEDLRDDFEDAWDGEGDEWSDEQCYTHTHTRTCPDEQRVRTSSSDLSSTPSTTPESSPSIRSTKSLIHVFRPPNHNPNPNPNPNPKADYLTRLEMASLVTLASYLGHETASLSVSHRRFNFVLSSGDFWQSLARGMGLHWKPLMRVRSELEASHLPALSHGKSARCAVLDHVSWVRGARSHKRSACYTLSTPSVSAGSATALKVFGGEYENTGILTSSKTSGKVTLWDMSVGCLSLLRESQGCVVVCTHISSNGRMCAQSTPSAVHIYDVASTTNEENENAFVPVQSTPHSNPIHALAFQEVSFDSITQASDWLACVGSTNGTYVLNMMDLNTASYCGTYNIDIAPPSSHQQGLGFGAPPVVYAAHNRVCVCVQNTIHLYDTRARTHIATLRTGDAQSISRVSKIPAAKGGWAFGANTGHVHVLRMGTHATKLKYKLCEVGLPTSDASNITCMKAKEHTLVCGSETGVESWDMRDGFTHAKRSAIGCVRDLDFDCAKILVCTDRPYLSRMTWWTDCSEGPVYTLGEEAYSCVSINPYHNCVASTSDHGITAWWEREKSPPAVTVLEATATVQPEEDVESKSDSEDEEALARRLYEEKKRQKMESKRRHDSIHRQKDRARDKARRDKYA